MYCVLCKKKHVDWAWRSQKWFDDDLGEEIEGWACRKYFKTESTTSATDKRLAPDREKYKKDMIQPFRSGEPSKEFADAYPKQAKKFFKGQKKKPKDVWK